MEDNSGIGQIKKILSRIDERNEMLWNEDDQLLDVMVNDVSTQLWKNKYSRERNYGGDIIGDIIHESFKGRDEDALEEYRLQGLEKIEKTADILEKMDIFYEYSRRLRDDIKMLDYQLYVSQKARILHDIDVCKNMFSAGKYSLSDIKEILPWLDLSDIYGVSKMLHFDMAITEAELEVVKEEYHKTGNPKVLKEMFGEPQKTGVSMKDIFDKIEHMK